MANFYYAVLNIYIQTMALPVLGYKIVAIYVVVGNMKT